MKFFCSTILAAILGSFAQINVSGAKLQQQPCLVVVKVTQLKSNKQLREFHCVLDDVDKQPNGASTVKIDGLSKEDLKKMVKAGEIVPGKTTMMDGTAKIIENKIVIPIGSKPTFSPVNEVSTNIQEGLFTGEKDVLVVRVIGSELGGPALTQIELANRIFGTDDDEVNLTSGFDDCSKGQLVFLPFENEDLDPLNGVYEIDFEEGQSTTPDTAESVSSFVTDLLESEDIFPTYTIFCMPPGLSSETEGSEWDFITLEEGNVAIFNDLACQYPSLLMNSFGVMLGLGPSTAEVDEDESCVMGLTYSNDHEFPKKCFNGAKLWLLNWYADDHQQFDPETVVSHFDLIGIAEVGPITTEKVVVKISNVDAAYYVYFNRAIGMTENTGTEPDKVMIVETEDPISDAESLVVAVLGEGDFFVIEDYLEEGEFATVLVNSIDLESVPAVADVTILVGLITESPSTSPSGVPSTTPSVSFMPSSLPSSSPSKSLVPSTNPSALPSKNPSSAPSNVPSKAPSSSPSESSAPSELPSSVPSTSLNPSSIPSATPSTSSNPSVTPSAVPSKSSNPSSIPSATPSLSKSPTVVPVTKSPVTTELSAPSGIPSSVPSTSLNPSSIPSATPSTSSKPSSTPSSVPSKSPSALQCTTLLDSFSWEDGITPFIDGGNDARRYRGYASEGDYSLRLRDDRYMASSIYLPATYLSSYTHFKVSFSFITKRMDDVEEDGLFLEGNPTVSFGKEEWEQFGSWVYGVDFLNDQRYFVTTDLIDKSSYGTGPFVLRFRGHSSNNLERFFLDEMTVIGCV